MKTSQTKFVGVFFFLFHLYVTTRTYIHHHFLVGFSLMLFFLQRMRVRKKKIIIRNKNKTKRRYTNKSPLDSSFIRLHIYTHFYNKHRLLCFVIKMNLIIDSNRVLIVKKKKTKKAYRNRIIRIFPLQLMFFFSFAFLKLFQETSSNGWLFLSLTSFNEFKNQDTKMDQIILSSSRFCPVFPNL